MAVPNCKMSGSYKTLQFHGFLSVIKVNKSKLLISLQQVNHHSSKTGEY